MFVAVYGMKEAMSGMTDTVQIFKLTEDLGKD